VSSRILLDSNIVSDLVSNPKGHAADRVASIGEAAVATSLIVAAELRYGAARKASPRLTIQLEQVLGVLEVIVLEVPADRECGEVRTRPEAAGIPIDAAEMLFDQVDFIARNLESEGGEIAFVTHVGDVWQHATGGIDAEHLAMGLQEDSESTILRYIAPDPRALTVEAPAADRAFRKLADRVPFSIVPGNHDYDGFWFDSRFAAGGLDPHDPIRRVSRYWMAHYGRLDNFNSIFGDQSAVFADRPWRVGSFNGGANSATLFEAAGYQFLHLGFELAPEDDVLQWAEGMIGRYPGLPTIVTIHDHLNIDGERLPNPAVDLKAVHPEHNSPEDLWQKFLSRHHQVFLVLSGHQHGQSRRVDSGAGGGKVWQLLADYQHRHQALQHVFGEGRVPTTPIGPADLGDGWIRLLNFDFTGPIARLQVRTYSTHFKAYASDLPEYARWYKSAEHPELSDAQFLAEDEFSIDLDDFYRRFGQPARAVAAHPVDVR
jgi:predicted nucleic acid-binding protein